MSWSVLLPIILSIYPYYWVSTLEISQPETWFDRYFLSILYLLCTLFAVVVWVIWIRVNYVV
jgi:hypothetical protein